MGQTTLSESLRAVEAEIAAGRAERALERCQQLTTQFPRALAVQRVLGEIYLALRKPREALGALDRALAGNPEDARACCARAIVHQLHGNSAGALDYYRRACDITPDDQVLRAAYRELAASLGQPPYQPSRTGLARLYLRGDLLSHALREWESLVAEQPDSLEAQVGLTEALWRSGALDAAEERSRRILDNSPSCVKALLILAALEHDAGHAEEARRLVARAAELDPDQRIAQSLFADRLAAGDRILSLNDDTAPAVGVPRPAGRSAPLAAPGAERPRVWTRPLVNQATQPPQRAASGSASLPLPAEPPRASALPPDFHSMFAETEYMLWSREDTEKHEALDMGRVGRGFTPPFGPTRAGELPPGLERGTPSSALVPPALREQGFSLEETEARAAINWVNWLQAQGARPHGSAPPASAAQAARRRTVPPSDPQPTGRRRGEVAACMDRRPRPARCGAREARPRRERAAGLLRRPPRNRGERRPGGRRADCGGSSADRRRADRRACRRRVARNGRRADAGGAGARLRQIRLRVVRACARRAGIATS